MPTADDLIGHRVEIWEDLKAGSWAAGKLLDAPQRNTNVGVVTEYRRGPVGPQIRVQLESGYLVDLGDQYPHKGVWHLLSDGYRFLG